MMTHDKATEILALAAPHVANGASMSSSAKLAYKEAVSLLAAGDPASAAQRATDSLSYSVGVFHADTRAAFALRVAS